MSAGRRDNATSCAWGLLRLLRGNDMRVCVDDLASGNNGIAYSGDSINSSQVVSPSLAGDRRAPERGGERWRSAISRRRPSGSGGERWNVVAPADGLSR
ncbi:hypothetical protein TCAP_04973 [Tolypocladium capitatum]|uniref:Uncharacterized protein n=1 Tax=Tolypocladium capitatum TaxID=45235 RepID=A0A2K3QC10_9HYPO|nr:hypothetical protein TCAP_04973 [Tolypocladium capitatum]